MGIFKMESLIKEQEQRKAEKKIQEQIKEKQNTVISFLRKFFQRAYMFAYKKMDFVLFLFSISIYFALPAKLDYDITSIKEFIKRNGGIKKEPAMGGQGMRPY